MPRTPRARPGEGRGAEEIRPAGPHIPLRLSSTPSWALRLRPRGAQRPGMDVYKRGVSSEVLETNLPPTPAPGRV